MAEFDLKKAFGTTERKQNNYQSLLQTFPYRPTVFLGLGGTGCHTVSKIKQLFEEVYLPTAMQDPDAGTQRVPQMYQFLGFDTHKGDRPTNMENGKDWHHMPVANIGNFYQQNAKTKIFRDWVAPELPFNTVTNGASGYRNIGKICLYLNFSKVAAAIDKARGQVMIHDPRHVNHTPAVYVFCSLSGGTGAGTFLDVAFYLRQNFEQAEIVGMLGLLEGLPSMSNQDRRKVQVNTYHALRELDAFMTNRAKSVRMGSRYDMPFGREGLYRTPFNRCYLFQALNDNQVITLPSHDHFTSYMARVAFWLSAYAYRGDGQASIDYDGVMSNHLDKFSTAQQHGTFFPYIVPGMGQMHFPIDQVVDLFIMDAAQRYLRHQCGGHAPVDDQEARSFQGQHGLTAAALQAAVLKLPGTDKPLAPATYDERISELMNESVRCDNREETLAYGDAIPAARTAEIQGALNPNIAALVGKAEALVRDKVKGKLTEKGSLTKGALDFVTDLRDVLEQELDLLVRLEKNEVQRDYDDLSTRWQSLRSQVVDVCTDEGIIDAIANRFRAPKVRDTYIAFLNESEVVIIKKARMALARAACSALIEHLRALEGKLKSVFQSLLPEAAELIIGRRQKMVDALEQQTMGGSMDVSNIRSVNVLSSRWRGQWFDKSSHYKPEVVLENLVRSEWHPIQLLDESAPSGTDLVQHLAETIVQKIAPFGKGDRELTALRIITESTGMQGSKPGEVIAGEIFDHLLPQGPITAGHQQMMVDFIKILCCGGIDKETLNALGNASDFQFTDFLPAENWEEGRFSFLSTYLPISLAGCNRVADAFERTYEIWREDLYMNADKKVIQNAQAMFRCFPESQHWPSPTKHSSAVEEEKRLFALALALSDMVLPDEADLARMGKASKGPKDRRYGIFQVGRSEFWLWPFFLPHGKHPITEKLVRLGTNVLKAYDELTHMDKGLEHAKAWVDWFDDNWSSFYTAPQLEEALNRAVEAMAERQVKVSDPAQEDLYRELLSALDRWRSEKL